MVASCFCLGGTSFEAALRKGDVPAALDYLHGDDPLTMCRTTFGKGHTMWHLAANGGHVDLLQALVERMSEVWPPPPPSPQHHPDGAGNAGGGTPFQRRSHPFQRISDGLRGRVPDPSPYSLAAFIGSPNVLGQTPLMTASKHGHADAVHFLMSVGSNPWHRDRGHCTVLHYATLHDQAACIRAILGHPASARPPGNMRQIIVRLVDLPNSSGYSPLHFAAAAAKPAALVALMACGANIAARCWEEGVDWISGPRGSTPLHLAARRGDMPMCRTIMMHYLEVLRDSGAVDPRLLSDARGCRPYQLAVERGSAALAEMLMPSTPLAVIFAGSDAVRLYNVPKLKALASAALQGALLSQINTLEVEVEARRQQIAEAGVAAARSAAAAAAALAGGGGNSMYGADGGAGGAEGLSRAPSLMASVSGALDAVRRQSLRSVRSLQQRLKPGSRVGLRRTSAEIKAAAAAGGGGGGEGAGGGVGLAVGAEPSGYTASVYSNSVYGGVDTSLYGANINFNSQFGSLYPASVMGNSHYANLASDSQPAMPVPGPFLAPRSHSDAGGPLAVAATSAAAGHVANAPDPRLGGGGGMGASPGGGSPAGSSPIDRPSPRRPGSGRDLAAVAPTVSNAAARGAASAGGGSPSESGDPAVGTAGAAPLGGHLASRSTPSLPGGVSPLHRASFESERGVPSSSSPPLPPFAVPPPWLTAAGQGASGAGGPTLPPLTLHAPASANSPASALSGSPFASQQSQRQQQAGAGTGGPAQCTPPRAPAGVSPFAMPAAQQAPLGRRQDAPLSGGSPPLSTHGSNDVGVAGSQPGGRSPPAGYRLQSGMGAGSVAMPLLGLHPVDEGGPGDEGPGDSCYLKPRIHAATSVGAPGVSNGGSSAQPPASAFGYPYGYGISFGGTGASPAGGSPVGGSPAGGSPRSIRTTNPGMGYQPGRPAHDSGSNLLLGVVGEAGGGSVGGGGGGGGGLGSRRGSGRLVAAGSVPVAGGGVIGSDTSEDFCGICFERPAVLLIQPCQHLLCAECSREVTRMVETQPPSCPFCRGLVHGFGC